MYPDLVERFIRYAKINTRSDEYSSTIPSTASQVEFSKMLAKDLEAIGLSDVEHLTETGFVTATLPSNTEDEVATIGFIAHIDTADFNAENINPQIVKDYDGTDIVLNKEEDIVLSPSVFPNLKNYIGQTLITTDGTTLLGSDDKSGVVEIISAMKYLIEHPEIKHGKVRIAFGPDEEIGQGATHFNVDHFGADFAYTVDGGPLGELQYESFNAASARVHIKGQNVHPGSAKDKMVNALKLAIEFDEMLPAEQVPERTDGRDGFYHILEINGTVEEADLNYIIRDHSREEFENKKAKMQMITDTLNKKYGDRFTLNLKDEYYNMAEVIKDDMRPVELAQKAMENIDIVPIIEPIRGGTDGSIISFMGLPTPNLFAGGENFHGRYEYVSVEAMVRATDTIVEIIKLAAK
ncbi:peptidase T [Allofustis seminis]|uniref:peptidase T n=1 Tax=Allofustis seminis TaxID=166939 RepID=UPI000366CF6F|nr:peptidase T [Allofustis seminis]